MNLDFSLIENASLLAFALVFLGGLLTSLGPWGRRSGSRPKSRLNG